MVVAVNAGVVNVEPVAKAIPPVGAAYQLIVVPAGAVAARVMVWPELIDALFVVTVARAGSGFTVTLTAVRVVLVQFPFAAST